VLFLVATKDGKKCSVLLKSLNFFVTKLAMFDITAARDCFPTGVSSGDAGVFTPKEIDNYNR